MTFTRNPATGTPATYTGTDEVDSLVLIDQASQITIRALDADDSIIVTGQALTVGAGTRALSAYTIYGNDGDDSITISASALSGSLIQGGSDDDTINLVGSATGVLTASNTIIRGGADDDSITVSGLSFSTVNGNAGSDTITVTSVMSNSRVFGGADNDTINLRGRMLATNANGSNGSDTINIGTTAQLSMVASTIFGGAGHDFIFAANNDNDLTVSGDDGNDVITFGATTADGDNSITTGSGTDTVTLTNATGDNTINTGIDADLITFADAANGNNTVVFDRGDSVAATATNAAGIMEDDDTVTFGDGVDRITNFTSATDEIDVDFTAVAATAVDGVEVNDSIGVILDDADLNTVLNANAIYNLTGALVGNTFTAALANAAGTTGTGVGIYFLSGQNQTLGDALLTSTNMIYSSVALAFADFV